MSAWVLPDYLADVLPAQALHIENLRRAALDAAERFGYELVIPPLAEHLESLLSGTGEALQLQTFKLVDQISGRSLGLRADTTPQVARIDAHLLNRAGVARLCYCGPVLHTKPAKPHATREPLQFGAEVYGHAGCEAELEVLDLALDVLGTAGLIKPTVDLGDVRVVRALLCDTQLDAQRLVQLHMALSLKDAHAVADLTQDLPSATRYALRELPRLWGDGKVLDELKKCLPRTPIIDESLSNLKWLGQHLGACEVRYDLADLRGYAYYSGLHFALYAQGLGDAAVRGGRYDEVGAIFGRKRPAVGFSTDLKELAEAVQPMRQRGAIRAPWSAASGLRQAVAALRARGETVVCVMPGAADEPSTFSIDRQLVQVGEHWVVQAL